MREVLETADDECQKLWETCSLGYTESLGDPMLLQEIWAHYRERASRQLKRRSLDDQTTYKERYTEQRVLQITTCVPVEGIYVSMLQLLQAGDHVICLAPAYQALYEIARSKGCVLHQWRPRYNDDHFWHFTLEDLQQLLRPFSGDGVARKRLRMLVINSPHNPTGACFSQRQFDEIGDILDKLQQEPRPIFFSDEMYSDILPSRPSAVGKQSSIVLSGLSKPWGMPGLRVGWLLVQDSTHFEKIAAFRDYTTLCLPPQSEILGIIALRGSDKFLNRNRELARKNYKLLQEFLCRNPRWFCSMKQHKHNDLVQGDDFAAVTLFARLKSPLGGHAPEASQEHLKSMPKFVEHLAQKCSLCLVAGDFFEFKDFPCVRFGIGRESFETALRQLEEVLIGL